MKYITRSTEGIQVFNKKTTVVCKGLKQYIDELCIQNLSTFKGRSDAAKRVLQCTTNLPIYVNESILLFPTKSIRNMDCVYINFYRVLSVQKVTLNSSKIIFDDLTEMHIQTSHKKLQNQMLRSQTICEHKRC